MKIAVKDIGLLKELVLKKGFTQRSFGRAIEISEPYSNQILNGTRRPGPEIAKKMLNKLEVEFDDIFFIQSACKSGQTKTA